MAVGKTDWKTYGGVHPKKHGNRMCATMIENALLKAWAKPLPVDAQGLAHPRVEPLDNTSYIRGRFLAFEDVTTDGKWKVGVPDWPNENKGMVRPRFRKSPMITSSTPHATLRIDFSGTGIGAYMLAGSDAGVVRCTVDGALTKDVDTRHGYNFNYPTTVMFFNDLAEGEHTLELEILEDRPGRPRPGGASLRVLHFTAN